MVAGLIASTIAFFAASYFIKRWMDENDIPKGMTRSVSIFGPDASDFSVNASPLLAPMAPTIGRTNFTLSFKPSALGYRTAWLRVVNNDNDENPYRLHAAHRRHRCCSWIRCRGGVAGGP